MTFDATEKTDQTQSSVASRCHVCTLQGNRTLRPIRNRLGTWGIPPGGREKIYFMICVSIWNKVLCSTFNDRHRIQIT